MTDENEAIEPIEDLNDVLLVIVKFQKNTLSRYVDTIQDGIQDGTNLFIEKLTENGIITPEMSSKVSSALERGCIKIKLDAECNISDFDSLDQSKAH